MGKTGMAYGLFSCNDQKEEVERSIRCIRDYVGTPSGMEMKVRYMHEFREDPKSPAKLVSLLDEAEVETIVPESRREELRHARPVLAKDLKYVIEASQTNTPNNKVAQRMSNVMNGLYDKNEPFHAARVFERDGEYIELTEE